ncbi:MAG TPA: 4-hydroxythreonine-4-phosphate dehydrogenase PdxA [Saprospiraceae bacterium]|nr:4-hydroxythreonine-4-phosphate dehydrogenase PdxA [Saprospiraceae bacterium]
MKIGITIGEINGIGPEVILKALTNNSMVKSFTPIIYGSSKILSYYKNTIEGLNYNYQQITDPTKAQIGKINIINCWEEQVNVNLGKASAEGGKYALLALERATQDLKDNHIDALVTAPINKESMKLNNFNFPGHTEYLEDKLGADSLMMMVSQDLKVALVTNHLPLQEVASKITKQLILKKISILNDSLIKDFDKERPTIAVLGLNPHAGDNGAIGEEEEKIIKPAIIEAKKSGVMVFGPYSADGFFGSGQFKKVDAILAMYHDQGLIPFKALTFGTGVNFTAGLNKVRTSPDHGTGFDIVGKNLANPDSMRAAIFNAIEIAESRKQYADDRKNRLQKRAKGAYVEEEDEIIIEEKE